MARLSAAAPFIHPGCSVTDVQFGAYVEIGQGTRLAHCSWGDYSYCDRFADVANAEIGKFANIASCVRIGATDHPMHKASQHHFLYRSADYFDNAADDAGWFAHRRSRRAYIGHDTWLGHAAQVRPEVRIGHGAVVASGAIVTKDVPDYTIVVGIPAAPMRPRFPQAVVEGLLDMAWWDWPHEVLRDRLENFRRLAAADFLEKYA
jgi:phosphonate metabolism protein (transferase hexapeptide repeat family)